MTRTTREMNDAERIAAWTTITDPLEALAEISDHAAFLGGDTYYSDLVTALTEMADRITSSMRRVRHSKRGSTYVVLGDAEVQAKGMVIEGEVVTVYRCESDGLLWVRPRDEFNDGRFEDLEKISSETTLQRPEEQA